MRLADEHDRDHHRVERWWTQASLPILCQYIVDPTIFGDELLYLSVALHLSRLSTPSSSYGVSADSFGKMHVCSSVVLAAEARKAESASVEKHNELPGHHLLPAKTPGANGRRQSPRSGWLINLLLVSRRTEPSSNNQHRQQCAYCPQLWDT